MALVSRCPFAREELHRKVIPVGEKDRGCTWCGQKRKSPKGKLTLFEYTVETDGGRKITIRGKFCSNDCRKTHHG